MRRERHSNAQTLTLNGTINASATSISVTGATSLPSEGDYRITIGDELLKVVARTGNTLTVERGAESSTPCSANTGSEVQVIATEGGVNKLLWDAIGPDYLSMDAPMSVRTINSSSLSWVNQGTSSVSDDTWGGMTMLGQNSSPHSLRCLVKSQPSTPFTFTARVDHGVDKLQGTSGSFSGILLRESGTGKIITISQRSDSVLAWFAWNSPTAFAATISTTDLEINPGGWWLKFVHDGTDIEAFVSADGLNWFSIGTIAKTTRFTTDSDQIGWFFANYGVDNQMVHLKAWDEA